jgi:hypothetical protein
MGVHVQLANQAFPRTPKIDFASRSPCHWRGSELRKHWTSPTTETSLWPITLKSVTGVLPRTQAMSVAHYCDFPVASNGSKNKQLYRAWSGQRVQNQGSTLLAKDIECPFAESESLLRCLALQTHPNFTRSPQKPILEITFPANHILATPLGAFRAPKSTLFTCQSSTFSTLVQPGGRQRIAKVAWLVLRTRTMTTRFRKPSPVNA